MLDLLHTIGHATASALWAPVLLWTLVAALAWGALGLFRTRLSALTHYWMHAGLLVSLPVSILGSLAIHRLPLLTQPPAPLLPDVLPIRSLGRITVDASASAPTATSLLFVVLGGITLCAAGAALVALWQLLRDTYSLYRLRGRLSPNASPHVQNAIDALTRSLGLQQRVRVHVSDEVPVPMACGVRHPLLLLPPDIAADAHARRLAATHELVHIQRRDYLLELVLRAVRALAAIHPLVHRLYNDARYYREVACDATSCAQPYVERAAYARLLLRCAQRPAAPLPALLPFARSNATLKPRLHAMSDMPTPTHPQLSILASVLLLVFTFGLVACADAPSEETPTALDDASIMNEAGDAYIQVDSPPQLDGGTAALYENITYPDVAREHNVEGRVIVQFVVSTDGTAERASILSSPEAGDGTPPEAIEALENKVLAALDHTSFTPGELDGTPVDTQMSLPVVFQLPE
ncbi:MAG: M56 family metallopeptidase [Longimonas sp.]|uniref:M56 family metallopeptidase n=1 Tax=Longimonas sp. TaxID=2039626 RepID=UPI0033645EEF